LNKTTILGITLGIATASVALIKLNKPPATDSFSSNPSTDTFSTATETNHTDKPEPKQTIADRQPVSNSSDASQLVQPQTNPDTGTVTSVDNDRVNVLELGKEQWTEASLRFWVGRLRSDPLLLQSTLQIYLDNRDPVRARNLAAVLAEVNSPAVVDVAAQLSQSAETASQIMGLTLLAKLQPNNTHARNAALDLLTTQSDPELLVATLNVFASPAQVVSADQRQLLLDHAQLLTSHENANVRALSISTISSWSKGNSNLAATHAAAAGLRDSDGAVRANAAAALIGVQNPSADALQGLLTVAANTQEPKSTRQLALYALSKMPLSETEKLRYEKLEVELRRTR